jgi:hypothetical protein
VRKAAPFSFRFICQPRQRLSPTRAAPQIRCVSVAAATMMCRTVHEERVLTETYAHATLLGRSVASNMQLNVAHVGYIIHREVDPRRGQMAIAKTTRSTWNIIGRYTIRVECSDMCRPPGGIYPSSQNDVPPPKFRKYPLKGVRLSVSLDIHLITWHELVQSALKLIYSNAEFRKFPIACFIFHFTLLVSFKCLSRTCIE